MKSIIICLLLLFCSTSSFSKTVLLYVNGIYTGEGWVKNVTMENIKKLVESSSISGEYMRGDLELSYMYNPKSIDLFGDVAELLVQALNEGVALDSVRAKYPEIKDPLKSEEYSYELGVIYLSHVSSDDPLYSFVYDLANRILEIIKSGDSVIVLSYSQGNFYAEAANAVINVLLKKSIDEKNLRGLFNSRVRFVGVAAVSATTPNGRYVTHYHDRAVFYGQESISNLLNRNNINKINPLPYNVVACVYPCNEDSSTSPKRLSDFTSSDNIYHDFDSFYMNGNIYDFHKKRSLSSVVMEMVVDSYNELRKDFSIKVSPFFAEISNDTIFSVYGNNLKSGMGFSIEDCHPSNNELAGGDANLRKFRCTINGSPGVKKGFLKDAPGGNIIGSFNVVAVFGGNRSKWISSMTPPGYVVKIILNSDLIGVANGEFFARGEYHMNHDRSNCNLSQELEIYGRRENEKYFFDITYSSPESSCPDGSHTANQGYREKYTGTIKNNVIYLENEGACSFYLYSPELICYNFESISPMRN